MLNFLSFSNYSTILRFGASDSTRNVFMRNEFLWARVESILQNREEAQRTNVPLGVSAGLLSEVGNFRALSLFLLVVFVAFVCYFGWIKGFRITITA